jgi:hypothetical protein
MIKTPPSADEGVVHLVRNLCACHASRDKLFIRDDACDLLASTLCAIDRVCNLCTNPGAVWLDLRMITTSHRGNNRASHGATTSTTGNVR